MLLREVQDHTFFPRERSDPLYGEWVTRVRRGVTRLEPMLAAAVDRWKEGERR